MKGAQSLVVDTCFSKSNKLANHINDVGGLHNLIYRRSVNHQPLDVLLLAL